MATVLNPSEVERWLLGLGSLIPREALFALAEEVRKGGVDGDAFDTMVASRVMPSLGDSVRPSHMATLRRCWNAGKPAGGSAVRQGMSQASSTAPSLASNIPDGQKFAPPRRGNSEASREVTSEPTRHHESHKHSTSKEHDIHDRHHESQKHSSSKAYDIPDRHHASQKHLSSKEHDIPERHLESLKHSASKAYDLYDRPHASRKHSSGKGYEMPEHHHSSKANLLYDADADDLDAVSLSTAASKASKRPPQVPRLDLTLIHRNAAHRGADEELGRHKWRPPVRSSKSGHSAPTDAGSSSTSKDPTATAVAKPESTSRVGFFSASSEDQQRIAEFYGYRDEGFVATMNGLRTDSIRSRLYVGNMADAAYWPLLKKLGITHIVNCAVEAQKVSPAYESHGIKYVLFPWRDSEEQAMNLGRQKFRELREGTAAIRAVLKGRDSGDNVVLVHCVQGLSRSAALVCSYLMEYEGMALDRALSEVKSKHRGCLSSSHWQAMLHKFNAELLKGS